MKINKNRFIYFILSVIFIFFLYPLKASSAGLSFELYPPIIQIQTNPPANISTPIIVKNLSDEALSLQIIMKPFSASSPSSSFLAQNLQISDNKNEIKSLTLAPKQQKRLNLRINIPQNYTLSDYYFSVIFLSKNTDSNNSNETKISGGLATNVLLSVGTDIKPKGELEEFSAPFFVTKVPLPFTVKIKNTGNHFITPHGYILIKNIFGKIVDKINLMPVNILVNSTRSIPSINQLDLSASNHNVEMNDIKKAYWSEAFIPGPYTATLIISLSNQEPALTKTLYFIGLPIKIAIELLIAALVVIFIIVRIKIRVRNR